MARLVAEHWWSMLRRAGAADIFHVELTAHAGREAHARGWLDAEERARCNRITHGGRHRQSVLCRRLGCRNDELEFRESGHGKPIALLGGTPAPVSFGVSHSGRHGLLAVAREGRLGADVEERVPRRDLDALIGAVLTSDERAEIELLSGSHRIGHFFGLWTVKEALIKALGTGLTFDMARIEAPPAMRRGVSTGEFRFPHLPAVTWRVEQLGNEHFAAAVAHERGRTSGAAGSSTVSVAR